MPYISTSIVMQLLTLAVPYFQKCRKMAKPVAKNDKPIYKIRYNFSNHFKVCLCKISIRSKYCIWRNFTNIVFIFYNDNFNIGTVFVMWLGEQIQERGLGNGISLIIMANIIARLYRFFFGPKPKHEQ